MVRGDLADRGFVFSGLDAGAPLDGRATAKHAMAQWRPIVPAGQSGDLVESLLIDPGALWGKSNC